MNYRELTRERDALKAENETLRGEKQRLEGKIASRETHIQQLIDERTSTSRSHDGTPCDCSSCTIRELEARAEAAEAKLAALDASKREIETQVEQLRQRVAWLEGTALPHARSQENANGFQIGWHAALQRVADGDPVEALQESVPRPVQHSSPRSEAPAPSSAQEKA